jgi:hypothetical protein
MHQRSIDDMTPLKAKKGYIVVVATRKKRKRTTGYAKKGEQRKPKNRKLSRADQWRKTVCVGGIHISMTDW